MLDMEGDDVVIVGCPNGIDFDVVHANDEVVVTAADGREYRLSAAEWRKTVCAFSDAVETFYAVSSPKQPSDDDKDGYAKFRSEWSRHRSLAE